MRSHARRKARIDPASQRASPRVEGSTNSSRVGAKPPRPLSSGNDATRARVLMTLSLAFVSPKIVRPHARDPRSG